MVNLWPKLDSLYANDQYNNKISYANFMASVTHSKLDEPSNGTGDNNRILLSSLVIIDTDTQTYFLNADRQTQADVLPRRIFKKRLT